MARLLGVLGENTQDEQSQHGSLADRHDFTYRRIEGRFRDLLNSYYLDSGCTLDVSTGRIIFRVNRRSSSLVLILGLRWNGLLVLFRSFEVAI